VPPALRAKRSQTDAINQLSEHEIILADGMPVESFLAADGRREAMRDARPTVRLFPTRGASVRLATAIGWEC
jgi:hypothetical protein